MSKAKTKIAMKHKTEPRPKPASKTDKKAVAKIVLAAPIVEAPTPTPVKLKTLAIKIDPILHANFYKAIGGKGKATAYLTAVLNLAVDNAGTN